jgi:ABC-2 type transport system ATP-binding protein
VLVPQCDGQSVGVPDPESRARASTLVEARSVSRRFDEKVALDGVSLSVGRGEIHALLGPNGAGKTTLLRTLTGLVTPTSGTVRVLGLEPARNPRALRHVMGLVPSGDRTFYLRISGLENLAFFGRLHGMRKRAAVARARELLTAVGLVDAADVPVGVYSHGMQKRLSVARALLADPSVLLVDEATHDLDPEGAERVRDLVRGAAQRGATILWATQRLDEIRGFADHVTLLTEGRVRFRGTVPELMSYSVPNRFVLQLRNGGAPPETLRGTLERAIAEKGAIAPAGHGASEHYVLSLFQGVILGDALASLTRADVDVLTCREERSEIEEAFLTLTKKQEGAAPWTV